MPITHIGNGKLLTPSHHFSLNNILRVPQIASNLLFAHKLCLHNNTYCYFDSLKFSIQDLPREKVLYKGLRRDDVYPIPPISSLHSPSSFPFTSSCNIAVSDQVFLWHNKVGHPCSKVLNFALSDVSSFTISNVSDICSQCTSCISAKMHKLPFPKHVSSSEFPLQLIHSDVWGPAPIVSILEHRFYEIFVDDFIHFTWLFLLKNKYDVFQVFLNFKALVEN